MKTFFRKLNCIFNCKPISECLELQINFIKFKSFLCCHCTLVWTSFFFRLRPWYYNFKFSFFYHLHRQRSDQAAFLINDQGTRPEHFNQPQSWSLLRTWHCRPFIYGSWQHGDVAQTMRRNSAGQVSKMRNLSSLFIVGYELRYNLKNLQRRRRHSWKKKWWLKKAINNQAKTKEWLPHSPGQLASQPALIPDALYHWLLPVVRCSMAAAQKQSLRPRRRLTRRPHAEPVIKSHKLFLWLLVYLSLSCGHKLSTAWPWSDLHARAARGKRQQRLRLLWTLSLRQALALDLV